MHLWTHSQRSPAQALVEFALVLPVMLLVLLGLVDFGQAYVAGVSLEGAAREGARLASTLTIPAGGNGKCDSTGSGAAQTWCSVVTARVQQAAQPERLRDFDPATGQDPDITICVATVSPPNPPPACLPGIDHVPTASGQAVTVTIQITKWLNTDFLKQKLGFQGVPVQASATMRIP